MASGASKAAQCCAEVGRWYYPLVCPARSQVMSSCGPNEFCTPWRVTYERRMSLSMACDDICAVDFGAHTSTFGDMAFVAKNAARHQALCSATCRARTGDVTCLSSTASQACRFAGIRVDGGRLGRSEGGARQQPVSRRVGQHRQGADVLLRGICCGFASQHCDY